jgi:hypothetical protein
MEAKCSHGDHLAAALPTSPLCSVRLTSPRPRRLAAIRHAMLRIRKQKSIDNAPHRASVLLAQKVCAFCPALINMCTVHVCACG